jgi:hypothetical protein
MTISTWDQTKAGSNYASSINWSAGIPSGINDTAEFEASNQTIISLESVFEGPGEWLFNPGATQYSFGVAPSALLVFQGNGIVINAGSVQISTSASLISGIAVALAEP